MSEEINIEAIMQEIRQKILTEKNQQSGGKSAVPVSGDKYPPEFYEHLYHASMAHDQIGVKMNVQPVNLPVVGRLLTRVKTALHTLILYYVNQVATDQMKVNHHLLQAISILAREEGEGDQDG